MTRDLDLGRFYDIIGVLEQRTGKRRLASCDGGMDWPSQGVYFFFEEGEVRAGGEPRVVRVGTHAVTAGSHTTLWNRLRMHRSGGHRGSIFRHHVGTALMRRDGLICPSWLSKHATAVPKAAEAHVETAVSRVIGSMPFLWVRAENPAGPTSIRGYLERNAIALLSNQGREPIDPPSDGWLGRCCTNPKVRSSGLWNADHTDEQYVELFLDLLARLVQAQ
ncbi:MAG: hypothetical protein M1401_16930 [Chloroflexi bacterium]|nr:hypothetical protein [Chloroflexota bacterium]